MGRGAWPAISLAFGFDSVATIGTTFGGIPSGLPSVDAPSFNLDLMIDLIGPAFTIAMIGAIESLLSAVVADGMAGTRHNSNQELTGQGIANIAVAMVGTPVALSIGIPAGTFLGGAISWWIAVRARRVRLARSAAMRSGVSRPNS